VKYTLASTVLSTNPGVAVWKGGTNSPSGGIFHSFTGLDTSLHSYVLTVEVHANDFFSSSEYVDEVSVGYRTLSSFCNPGVDNGEYFYTCVSREDVTSDMFTSYYYDDDSTGQQYLLVSTTASSSVDENPYLGFDFYATFTLEETTAPSINSGGGSGGEDVGIIEHLPQYEEEDDNASQYTQATYYTSVVASAPPPSYDEARI
jgi:hypothetical protein